MVSLSVLWLAAAAAAPASDALRFDGPSASATVDDGAVVLRVGEQVRQGSGSAFLRGEDRVRGREMTYGDAGELWMRVTAGADVYRVELDAVGFPPAESFPEAKRSWWRFWQRSVALPERPKQAVEGGVLLGRTLGGESGLGRSDLPARRATVALWGIGRVYRNDELIAPRARILAKALPAGLVAADGSLRKRLEGDPELDVIVDHLPAGLSPSGVLHFALDGAALSGAPAAVARRGETEPIPVWRGETTEERLGRRPTTDEQWNDGLGMLVWRDEERPAEGGERREGDEREERAEAPEGTERTERAEPAPAPAEAPRPAPAPAQAAAPAQAPAAAAPQQMAAQGYALTTPPWSNTVMQPPPPMMAVPATPHTAPIQYETGQNGPFIGTGLIGGNALAGVGGAGGFVGAGVPAPGAGAAAGSMPVAGAGTGVFGSTPVAGATPGTLVPGTGAAATAGAPGVSGGGDPLAVRGGYASPGIPSTPQPLNAQPTPMPGASFPLGGVPALPGTNPVTGLPQLTNQLPQQTFTPPAAGTTATPGAGQPAGAAEAAPAR